MEDKYADPPSAHEAGVINDCRMNENVWSDSVTVDSLQYDWGFSQATASFYIRSD